MDTSPARHPGGWRAGLVIEIVGPGPKDPDERCPGPRSTMVEDRPAGKECQSYRRKLSRETHLQDRAASRPWPFSLPHSDGVEAPSDRRRHRSDVLLTDGSGPCHHPVRVAAATFVPNLIGQDISASGGTVVSSPTNSRDKLQLAGRVDEQPRSTGYRWLLASTRFATQRLAILDSQHLTKGVAFQMRPVRPALPNLPGAGRIIQWVKDIQLPAGPIRRASWPLAVSVSVSVGALPRGTTGSMLPMVGSSGSVNG
jgi:hypothetical protein